VNVLLTAVGSAGDINPFIALGSALRQRGHRATLLAAACFGPQALAAGLDFLPLGGRPDLTAFSRRRVSILLHPRLGHRHFWKELVLPSVRPLVEALEGAVHSGRPDVVVYHPASFGARWVCHRRGLPTALGALSPLVWMSSRDGSVHARSLVHRRPPRWVLWSFLRLAHPLARLTIDPDLNAVRRGCGFPPGHDLFFDHAFGCDLNLGLWSRVFRGPMPDDPPNGRICGFTWYDRGHHVQHTDGELERFLEAGPPPIVFTLGTTVVAVAGSFYAHAAEACRRLGRRGVLLTGSDENLPRRLPAGVRAFRYAPFAALLPRACAIVHHGGIGTTAQALRSGHPTVVIPCAFDQFDNAERVRRLGVSLTLARTHVTPATLAAAVRRVLENPAVIDRARRVGAAVAADDGAMIAATALEELVASRGG